MSSPVQVRPPAITLKLSLPRPARPGWPFALSLTAARRRGGHGRYPPGLPNQTTRSRTIT